MDDEKWNHVLIQWVNCLKLCKNISDINDLRSGEFFSNLQKVITKSRNAQLDLLTFIFDLFAKHYPNFTFQNQTEIHLSDVPTTDLKSMTSLLMHYTCIYDRKDVLTSPLCHSLSQTTQLIIRNFLQKITKDASNATMNDIIKSCIDDASDHSTNHHWLSLETTESKTSPLQDLLKTPISKFGRLYEKDRIITKLKSELESERYDKAELQEELKLQLEKNMRFDQQLSQKNHEISSLRAEVATLDNRTPPHYQDMDSRELQRRLRVEIQSLEEYIKQIENEQEEIRREKDSLGEQLRKVERQSSIWEEKFFETERNFESLSEHTKKQEEELGELRSHCSEITALLEEYKSKPGNDSSLYDTFTLGSNERVLDEAPSCEDLACSVVEVQLREAQKQNEDLVVQIQQFEESEVHWKNTVVELEEQLKRSQGFNEELVHQLKNLEAAKETIEKRLVEVENDFIEIEQKLQEMTAALENVTTKLQEKSRSLEEASREKEEVRLKAQHLESRCDGVENKLSEALNNCEVERKRVNDLEKELEDAVSVSKKLQFELAESLLNVEALNLQRDSLKVENEVLIKDLDESLKFGANLRSECDCLQGENHMIKNELLTIKIHLSILEGEKAELISNLEEQTERSNNLQRVNEKLDAEVFSLQKELTESLENIGFSKKHIKKLEDSELLLSKQLSEVQKALEDLTASYAVLQNEKTLICGKLIKSEECLKIMETEKLELDSQLQNSEELCHTLMNNNKDLLAKNEVLDKEFEDTLKCLEMSKMETERLVNTQSSLKAQLEESENVVRTLRNDFEQTQLDNKKINQILNGKEIDLQQSEVLCCQLKKKNEDVLASVESVQLQLSDSQENIRLYKEDLQTLTDNRNLIRTQLDEAEANAEMLRNEFLKVEEEKLKLIGELNESRDQYKVLQQVKAELEESEAMYHSLCDDMKKEVAGLEKQLADAYCDIKRSNEASNELRQIKEENLITAAKLRKGLEKLQVKNTDLNKLWKKACERTTLLKEEKGGLLQKLNSSQKENEELRCQCNDLTEQLTTALNNLESAEAQAEEVKDRNLELETLLNHSNALSEDLKRETEEIRAQYKHSQQECFELNAEKTQIESRLQESEEIQRSLELKLNAVEASLEDQKREMDHLQSECNARSDELEKTTRNLLESEEERNILSTKLQELETRNKELLASVQNLEEVLSEERVTVANGKYMQDTLEKKIVDLWASLEETQIDKQKVNDALLNQKNENEILVSKLQDSDTKCLNLERQTCDANSVKNDLEMTVERLKKELNCIKSEIHSSILQLKESEENRNNLENEKETLTSKLEELEQKLNHLEREHQHLVLQNCNLEKQFEDSKAEYAKVDCAYQKSKATVEELIKEKEEIRTVLKQDSETLISQLAQSKENSNEFEKSRDELEIQNQNLQQRIESLIITNDQIIAQNQMYKDSLKELTEEKERTENEMLEEKHVLKENLAGLEKNYEVIEEKSEILSSENESLQKQLLDMKTLKEQIEHDFQNTEERLRTLAEEKENLEIKMKECCLENEDLCKQNEEFQRQITDLQMNQEELKSNNETIEKQLNEVSILSETLVVETEEVRLQLQKSKTELEKLMLALKDANVRNEELEKDMSAAKGNLQTNEQDLICMKQKEVEFKEALSTVKNENQVLISENEILHQKLIDTVNNGKESRDLLEAEIGKLTSTVTDYKNEIENVRKRANEAEQSCEYSRNELLAISQRLARLSEQNTVLEKKIEIEEIITSENHERVKSLEDTIQDYEITISGLKSVVDANLERIENLKEELTRKKDEEVETMKLINGLLKSSNIVCEEGQGDFKTFISENVIKMLKAKSEEEKQISQFRVEIKELKTKNINLYNSFIEVMGNLQRLVFKEVEFKSIEEGFDMIHAKVKNVLQSKEEISYNLRTAENEKLELNKQIESLILGKEKVTKTNLELERGLKEEKEKNENLLKKLESNSKLKPEKENILGASTKSNKSREEELKKENMMLKRKVVLTENAKNNLEKVLKELREEKKKAMATPLSPSNDGLYKKLLQEYIQVKEDHERIVKEKDDKIEALVRENEQIKMINGQVKIEDDKKMIQDLYNIREAYGNVMSANSKLELEVVTLRKVIEERNSEMAALCHIKEAYEKLLEENNKVMTETDTLKYKRMRDREEFVSLLKKEREENGSRDMKKVQEVRNEYEGKLEKMKEKMLKLYREEVNKKVKSVKDGQNETALLMKTIANLKSELFEADQKIQLLEMEKEMSKANRKFDVETRSVQMKSTSTVTSTVTNDERASTLPRPTITKEFVISQKTSIGGISNCIAPQNLQMEDEEDLFNDKYLTDLKEGRCALPADRESTCRFSELAWRNSRVPPHLKSSYPAEMQFVSPTRFKDEDIKAGNIEFEDSLCKLLPGEKPRKKDFGTTSYKRPGPPTPSKNGGRLSLQGNEVHPMKEPCETKTPKKSTPSRIKALFTGRNNSTRDGQDSQHNSTPTRGKRLSIFRRPR